MERIVVFGNSGSGKSSLARRLSRELGYPHLDLDSVAWRSANPPEREEVPLSCAAIDAFVGKHPAWVIEGCYGSLIEHAVSRADQVYFLNIGIEACVMNCQARPWEPDKYESREAQDRNLAGLIEWVRDYETREDEFSLAAHRQIFDRFEGAKEELLSNDQSQAIVLRK